MAKKGAPDVVISYDNGSGTPVDISASVREINGIEIENLQEESHGFGVSWFETLLVGMGKINDITLSGHYDDAVGGVHDLFSPNPGPSDATRTLTIQFGKTTGDKKVSVETRKLKYGRKPVRNSMVAYEAVLRPTGQPTEGTV